MTASVAPELPPSTEARQLAMVAHLLGLANFAFALAGLIGVIILYVTAKDDFVRVNARSALNMQITLVIYGAVFFVLYLIVWFSYFVNTFSGTHVHGNGIADFRPFAFMFAIFGLLFVGAIVTAILNGIGARRAYLGRVFRYPIAIPFLRDPEFPETPLAT